MARARNELGGDDFGEHLDTNGELFDVIRKGTHHLELDADATSLEFRAVPAN